MSNTYSIQEVLTFAVKIEEQGMSFYESVANKTKNIAAKELYLYLKDQEVAHRSIYQKMLNTLTSHTPINYSDEYGGYMRALVESSVFRKNDPAFSNDSDVLDYAIDREKDSILFYIEIKDHIPVQHHKTIETIINEERTHIIKLLDMKEKIG